MPITSTLQKNIYLLGLLSLIYSLVTLLTYNNSYFYTFFAFGSWLTLDFIDLKFNKNSLLQYFTKSSHHDAFIIFISIAFISFTIIDYLLGVNLSGMWQWTNITNKYYLVLMFTLMNFSFIFSMFELYRVLKAIIYKITGAKNVKKMKRNNRTNLFSLILLIIGVISICLPFYYFLSGNSYATPYIMAFAFLGAVLITDMLTYLIGGYSIVFRIVYFDLIEITIIVISTFIATLITERLNFLSYEWKYIEIPFENLKLLDVPISLYFGWFLLVILSIATINLIHRIDKIRDVRNLSLIDELREDGLVKKK